MRFCDATQSRNVPFCALMPRLVRTPGDVLTTFSVMVTLETVAPLPLTRIPSTVASMIVFREISSPLPVPKNALPVLLRTIALPRTTDDRVVGKIPDLLTQAALKLSAFRPG